MKILLQREESGWRAQVGQEWIQLDLASSALPVEAIALVRSRYDDADIGVRAIDIGPGTQVACLMAGQGSVLWLSKVRSGGLRR